MDEIDAALDFKNVSIVANYIKERTKNAQFVIISLRNNMFELADRLVGIYKTNDATKSVTINPKLFDAAVQGHRTENTAPQASTSPAPAASAAPSKLPVSAVEVRSVLADSTNTRI
jgi:structural maintenance of chromosome 4